MIPKRIFTVWLDENGNTPIMVRRCVESQKRTGYEHRLIDLEVAKQLAADHPYLEQCLTSPHINKRWCKASDWLRMHYLFTEGGIYLDADVEVLPGRNFDRLLADRMFVGRELNGWFGSAVVGSEAGHPFVRGWIDEVEARFRGDDDKNFESSMEILTKRYTYEMADPRLAMCVYDREVFFPYDHQTATVTLTPKTICYHHFMKSWIGPSRAKPLPTVSILIPQLGRPEGLKRCLESIKCLDYPKELLETLIDDREEPTVPQKVATMLAASTGDYLVYAANDMEFTPSCLRIAVQAALRTGKGLVALNTGDEVLPDEGNVNCHFVIRRSLVAELGGEIFDQSLTHCGVDNLLWAKAKKLDQAVRCEEAIVRHFHFSTIGQDDEVYRRGWAKVEEDRTLLRQKLAEL